MVAVLVTGMSGAGTSTALAGLVARGHEVVDTDGPDWIEVVDGEPLWRAERIRELLDRPRDRPLFVSGTVANQGRFRFDAVVLLTAPLDVLLERIRTRTNNPFGRTDGERAAVVRDHREIEPILRAAATHVIDTTAPPAAVVAELEATIGRWATLDRVAGTGFAGRMAELTPFLWFDDDLQDAIAFWAGIFPDTELVTSSAGPDGRVFSGTFRIVGRTFFALNGGPGHPHTDAFSLFVECADQAEVDRYWDPLAESGTPVACGWITDRFGISWQIVPKRLQELLGDPDPARAERALDAMMGMVKLDVAALEAAANG